MRLAREGRSSSVGAEPDLSILGITPAAGVFAMCLENDAGSEKGGDCTCGLTFSELAEDSRFDSIWPVLWPGVRV